MCQFLRNLQFFNNIVFKSLVPHFMKLDKKVDSKIESNFATIKREGFYYTSFHEAHYIYVA
jgi:hypothetical protein